MAEHESKTRLSAKEIMYDYKAAWNVRKMQDQAWNELDLFDRGEQWQARGRMPEWVPRPVTNFIHLVKIMKRASLAVENPTGRLRALSPDDLENVKLLQSVYEWKMKQINARSVFRDCLETAKLLGTAIAHIYYDPSYIGGTKGRRNKGRLCAEQIDPAQFFPDPSAFTLEECRFVHIVMRKHVSWLKKHPIFGKKMKDIEARAVSTDERGEIYERDYNSSNHTTDGIIDFHVHYRKVPLADVEGGFQYQVYYLAGENIVHVVEDLKPRCYPFSILYDFKQRQDFWGKSTCSLIIENQKIINKVEQIISMIGMLLQNPQKVIWKASGINPTDMIKYGNAPGHTFLSNVEPSRSVHWVQPPQIPQYLFQLAETAKDNIREITGLTEAYMGQTVGSLQTSGGVNALIERSTLRDRDQMYDFEQFIEDFSRKVIMYTVEYDTSKQYIAKFRGKYDEQQINDFIEYVGSDFKDIEYDFAIDVSAKAPITRVRMQEEMDKLLEIQGQYQFEPPVITPQEYVDNKDFINSHLILDRMKKDSVEIRTQKLLQVANMMHEGMMNRLPEQQIQDMAMQMIQQLDNENGKLGSAASVQDRQQGTGA